jgi:hypothetical protein
MSIDESDQAHKDKLTAGLDFLHSKKKPVNVRTASKEIWLNIKEHLWYNREQNKWYYSDETADFCGPFGSMNDAASALKSYFSTL